MIRITRPSVLRLILVFDEGEHRNFTFLPIGASKKKFNHKVEPNGLVISIVDNFDILI